MELKERVNLKDLAERNPLFAIDEIVQRHNDQRGSAIPILQDVQNTFGYVAPEVLQRVSELTGIPDSELYSIVTFYAQFRLEAIGENLIQVCHGTACHLAGAEKITEALQHETGAPAGKTSPDGKFTLEKVACVGCCSLAPVVNMNEDTHIKLTPDKARKIVKNVRKNSISKNGAKEKSGCKGACKDA